MRSRALAACALALVTQNTVAQGAAPAPRPPPPPPPPLPSLPVITRVRVDVEPADLVVTEDVRLSRGDWRSGDLDVYVSFGAPGAPRAFDAHLIALDEGAFEPKPGDTGEPVGADRAPRRPPRAQLLLGRETMAGVTVHLREPALRRAFSASGALVLRLRSLLVRDPQSREVVVRLGAAGGGPLALAAIDVVGDPKDVTRAEARLCGPNADPYPLAVRVLPARPVPVRYPGGAAPAHAVRHDDDDLCVRF